MVTKRDHSLTREGIENAEELHALWKSKCGRQSELPVDLVSLRDVTTERLEEGFAQVDIAFSSPLTRAVQTAQIVLRDHVAVEKRGIVLLRTAREIKRALSLDTVGKACGSDIPVRARDLLARVVGVEAARRLSAPVDIYDCVSAWHTLPQAIDTEGDVQRRMFDLMCTLRFMSFRTAVLVGHSLFLQALFRIFSSEEFKATRPHLADALISSKLSNSACICIMIDFTRGAQIVDVRPVFGTRLPDA